MSVLHDRVVSVAGDVNVPNCLTTLDQFQLVVGDAKQLEPPTIVWAAECDPQALAGLRVVFPSMASRITGMQKPTAFHCVNPPKMLISDYLDRLHKYFHCSDSVFVVALVYIDRVIQLHPAMTFSTLSCHRFLLTALVLAAKYNEDIYYSNEHYAKVGGTTLRELGRLEVAFLRLLDWRLMVSPTEYDAYRSLVCGAVDAADK